MNRFEPLQDEKIILEMPKHWKCYILPAVAMASILGAIALRLSFPDANLVNRFAGAEIIPISAVATFSYIEASILAFLMISVGFSLVDLAFTHYYVTNKRIVSVSGWLTARMSDMLLERVETVSLSQKTGEMLFRSGDLLCISAGASIYLEDVYDARRFRQTVMQAIEDIKN